MKTARAWTPPTIAELQRLLPQYEISEMLGRGGMGAVYKGVQRSLDRTVAIKILPPGIEDDAVHYAERFKIEAKAMARLSHPGIVAVFDAGETPEGLLFFVMEFIEGTDVQKMIAEGPIPAAQALAITAHVCDALGFAHESGIVHRDIKPANIMVDARGHVKIADFGLAKVTTQDSAGFTGTGFTMGTPNYMAPEAMTSVAQVDGRADLYAVGVMLYTMLTGQIPRGRFTLASATIPGLDPRFDAIVDKAMQADRENRYASAAALRTDLEGLLTAPIPVDAPLPRRRKRPWLIAALGFLVLGGIAAWWTLHGNKPASLAAKPGPPLPAPPPSKPLENAPGSLGLAKVTAYPQPAKWTDGTADLRKLYLGVSLAAEGEWLKGMGEYTISVAPSQNLRNPIVRVQYSERVDIALRRVREGGDRCYIAGVGRGHTHIIRTNPDAQPVSFIAPTTKLAATHQPAAEHEAVFAAQGDVLTLWIDGRKVNEGRDSVLTLGEIAISLKNDALGESRIKKIEYGELPDSAVPTYPQPAKWTDATVEVRRTALKDGSGVIDGDWLQVTNVSKTAAKFPLAEGREFRNAAVRVTFARSALIMLRDSKSSAYFGSANPTGRTTIERTEQAGPRAGMARLITGPPVPNFDAEKEHELVFAAQGDQLRTWMDGTESASVRDPNVTKGALSLSVWPMADPALWPRFKKVEYGELPDSPAPTYPQPSKWIDATADMRRLYGADGKLVAEGEWLKSPANNTFTIPSNGPLHNAIVRVQYADRADIALRRTRNGTDDLRYEGGISGNDTILTKTNPGAAAPSWLTSVLKAAPSLRPGAEHEAVFAAQGDTLTLWRDGVQIATARDSSFSSGEIALTMKNDALGVCRFKKVEYAELPDATPAAPAKKVSASYPQPAKWNDATAEVRSIAAKNGTGTIEGDWLQVTNLNKGAGFSLADGREFRNATVRLTFTRWANIHLRTSKGSYYSGGTGGGRASIEVQGGTARGQVNPRIATGTPIPNFDGEAEHEVVFAVQGDQITGWLDGVENVTAHDGTATSGALSLFFQPVDEARYQPRIKKVEYGELPESYPQPPKWTDATAALRTEALANGELVAEGEWLKATANREFILAPGLQSRNPIVRVVFSDRAEIWVRRAHTKPDDAFYSGTFRRANAMITLKAKSLLRLAETPLSDTLEGEHEAVFAAQGETLTLWLDGRQVVTAQDRTHSSGGISLMMSKGDAKGDCRLKKVEYGELPDTPPAK